MKNLFLLIIVLTGLKSHPQSIRLYEKGEIRLKFGLPYINSFSLNPQNESRKSQTGWVGLEGGLEYQYISIKFISAEFSMNAAAGVLGLLDIEGEFERFTTQSLNLTDNRTFDNFSIGYGLSFANNMWSYTRTHIPDSISPTRELVDRRSQNLGLILNSYFRIGNGFNIGLVYRPYFIKFKSGFQLDYEHLITLDFMWRIRIVK